ncbi:carboxypeptidase B [Tribolium castaneum]|uniref:Zinc carboxypeptidase A 1 n=1 Tax=Tribolium castaneum TaxID=7070 RepID=D6WX02_TRICA|nr:PREDICTED: carboxypeptidase B [Tribolium castaneum]EFA09249.1 carboxypeptidase A [Tribolium castaneum]|eukprot:XP_001810647.1 PREDICTED: carboxypeptidase B [Tribolium castaneum]
MKVPVLIVLALVGLSSAKYEGYKVYKFVTKTHLQNVYLQSLEAIPDFDFWSKINTVGNPVTVMVPPRFQTKIEDYLKLNNLEFSIEIENVGSAIHAEKHYHKSRQALGLGKITFDQYLRHAEINAYLAQLAKDYPDTVILETIGQSYEKRDMNLVRISSGPRDPPKPVIFVDAGIHAREWIAPAVALYLINQLVENPSNSNLLEAVDWIVLPSVNPDGYEFTWTGDRLWRKTRSPGTVCFGCDPNRNFGFHWMEAGASSWECSDTYAGKEAFSEVEARNLRDYLAKTANIKAYLTLHSYGQYLLYPWGYGDVLCDNWKELDDLGHKVDDAISSVNGTRYTIGSSTQVLYAAAGASDDWAMGGAGIDIVYTIELPGGGNYGFDLPASRIKGVVAETFEGFKVFADYVAKNRK